MGRWRTGRFVTWEGMVGQVVREVVRKKAVYVTVRRPMGTTRWYDQVFPKSGLVAVPARVGRRLEQERRHMW